MAEEQWEHAGFGDRFLGDLCDGALGLLVALLAYFVVDRWVLGSESSFLTKRDHSAPLTPRSACGSFGISRI